MTPGQDVFGRPQDPLRRLGPTGINCTLFVSYDGAGSLTLPKTRELLESNFGEWGPLANISIHHERCFAFVTYAWRCSAELAREAMDGQGLLGSTQAEVLLVRWSRQNTSMLLAIKRAAEDESDHHQEWYVDDWDSRTEEERAQHLEVVKMTTAKRLRKVVGEYAATDHLYADGQQQHAPPEQGCEQRPAAAVRAPAQLEQVQGAASWAPTGYESTAVAAVQWAGYGDVVAVAPEGFSGYGARRPGVVMAQPQPDAIAESQGQPASGHREVQQPGEGDAAALQQGLGDTAVPEDGNEAAWREWFAKHPEEWQVYYAVQQGDPSGVGEHAAGTAGAREALSLPGLLEGYGSDGDDDA